MTVLAQRKEIDPVAQADAYPDHARRQMLVRRVGDLLQRYYPPEEDPYRIFENEVREFLKPEHTLLDAGCGQGAPVLTGLASRCKEAIGVDLVDFRGVTARPNMRLIHGSIEELPVPAASVDVVMSRSVLEHLERPEAVFGQVRRALKPGGRFVFITPNIWSYPIVASRLVPNRLHAWLLEWAEGRPREHTFDTHYQSNSLRAVRRLARRTGFDVLSLRYLAMFPNYLMFHPAAFRLGIAYQRLTSRVKAMNFLQHWILGVLSKPAA